MDISWTDPIVFGPIFFYRHEIHLGSEIVIHNIDNKLKNIYQLCKREF